MIKYQNVNLKIDPANYMAIEILEWIGLDSPSQIQINIVESVISFFMRQHHFEFKN